MNNYRESKLLDISRQFHIYGDLLHAEPCKIGHINETYIATYNQGGIQVRYVHQKINTHVFKEPDAVMDNFVRVTSHQRRRLVERGTRDASRRSLTVIPTRDEDGMGQLTTVSIATGEIVQVAASEMSDPAGLRTAREAGVFAIADTEGNAIYRAE